MAFNFEKAIQDGKTKQEIIDYLSSQGRESEATSYFDTLEAEIKPQEDKGFLESAGEVGTGSITGSFSYTTSNLTGLVLLAIKPATVASNTTNFFQFFN